MDEINNNNNNPFDEQDNKGSGTPSEPAPYGQSGQDTGYDPFNQPANNNAPYNQPQQNSNPYAGQQNPYAQQGSVPYGQPQQNQNPYGQPQQNQNPYAQPYQQPYNPQQGAYNQQGGAYNRQNFPQQGYYQPQYGMPYQPYAQNQSAGMAVASLVLGIISIVISLFMWVFPPLFVLPIIGLVLGIVFKTKRLPVGKGISTAGIITSAFGLALPLLLLIVVAVLMVNHSLDGLMAEMLRQIQQTDPDLYQQYYEQFSREFPEWFAGVVRFFFR